VVRQPSSTAFERDWRQVSGRRPQGDRLIVDFGDGWDVVFIRNPNTQIHIERPPIYRSDFTARVLPQHSRKKTYVTTSNSERLFSARANYSRVSG
jgi:hypothetical protein